MKCTYTKLKADNEGWGARCECEDPFEELPAPGDEIEIEKRSGEKSRREVRKLVWQGNNEGRSVGVFVLV